MQERPPSRSTDRKIGKRRPLGPPPWCVPASPKTCRLCRARRAWRLTASWNGRLAVTVAVAVCALHRFGYASVGGDPPVDIRTKTIVTATPFTATITGSPRIGPKRELKRATEGYWAGRTSRAELEKVAATLRPDTWAQLAAAGLDSVPVNTFSY